jgi:hypothetical protein
MIFSSPAGSASKTSAFLLYQERVDRVAQEGVPTATVFVREFILDWRERHSASAADSATGGPAVKDVADLKSDIGGTDGGDRERSALATKMREAIFDKLLSKEDIFLGREEHVVLGAIADLAESLMLYAAYGSQDDVSCDWRAMVSEVHGEMLKWVRSLENC